MGGYWNTFLQAVYRESPQSEASSLLMLENTEAEQHVVDKNFLWLSHFWNLVVDQIGLKWDKHHLYDTQLAIYNVTKGPTDFKHMLGWLNHLTVKYCKKKTKPKLHLDHLGSRTRSTTLMAPPVAACVCCKDSHCEFLHCGTILFYIVIESVKSYCGGRFFCCATSLSLR